ncbi:cyclic beta 1-2 glucan synthetase [Bryobacterales bacterium F-183]|nr:cyclic beta 1-2 glucan synthetase [Bryobacterales bacterium F-183]
MTSETSGAGSSSRYDKLVLPGEVLVCISAEADAVLTAMRAIREENPVSTFVVPEDLVAATAVEPRIATDADWARAAAQTSDEVERSEARLVHKKLAGLEVDFDRVVADLIASATLGHSPGPAANWIIENSYLVQSETEEIRRLYEGAKYRDDSKANYAQVYALAKGLLRNHDHELNADSIRHALQGFQSVRPLTIAELWSFAILLRVALLSELSCLAIAAARAQQHREAAYLWADRLVAAAGRSEEELSRILGLVTKEKICGSSAFLAALSELLQGTDQALPALQTAAEEWGKPLAEQVREETAFETARAFTASIFFGSLRALGRMDLRKVFEEVSIVDQILRGDLSGTYARSDFETRDRCRQAVERISRQSSKSEVEVAELAVKMATNERTGRSGNVPTFLVTERVTELENRVSARVPLRTRVVRVARRHSTFVYFALMLGLTFSLDAVVLSLAHGFGVRSEVLLFTLGALALFPLSELAIQIVHAIIIATFPPAKLCRMDFEHGIPEEAATLVVVPMMLVNENGIRNELEKLEVRFLANPNANLSFALFSDFLDAEHLEEPSDAALLHLVRRGIAELNLRYPNGNFLLFHRSRQWSAGEGMYIGRERKRGKIEDLNSFLLGHADASGILREGKLEHSIRYVITLDADTMLPPNAGRRLVETIAHPCNEVEIDPITRVRTHGYTIIQPRVAITLPGATATRFTRVFADTSGLDPYCRSVSDIQQDFFSEGTFHGKAIYDVRAFETILGDRFPAETLLSHDLIEGAHAGVGLATDIELLENIPLDYASFTRRQHRWIRGDWQIAPWLMPTVPSPRGRIRNPLGAVSRWRIFDNLRRSLVPVASLLLLLFGWFASVAPSEWTVVVALAIIIPALAPLLDRWARNIEGTVHGRQGATDELVRSAVLAAFLPHQAWIAVDAIARVIYRRYVSRKRLLEWQTADAAERDAGSHRDAALRQMMYVGGASAVTMALLFFYHRLAPTAGFLGLWMLSPVLLTWLNAKPKPKDIRQLASNDIEYLHQAARLTWRFFDDLVNEDSNWLPPDNTQLALRTEVAYRTSPTNIGLWLTSAVAANDFGWLPPDDLVRRCTRTLESIDLLEKHDGHLLNWYDIKTLGALHPRYVSSVDSGNLLAALWTVDRAIDEILTKPVLDERCLSGLQTTLQILSAKASSDPYLMTDCTAALRLLRSPLREYGLVPRLRLLLHSADPFRNLSRWEATGSQSDRAYWAARFTAEVEGWTGLANRLLGWVETLSRPSDGFVSQVGKDVLALRKQALANTPSIATLARGVPALQAIVGRSKSPELAPEAAAWTKQLESEVRSAAVYAAELSGELKRLQLAIRRLADDMNMAAVYDEARRHFSVGHLVGGAPGAGSYYDLLASESRLTSLVSIAKGDVPIEHWFALGRPMRTEEQGRQLLSWSGTMFEYLMPLCFTYNYENSQLDFACRNAVDGQIRYGRRNGVPWGISESAYSALDARQTYQYRAFGIESLAQNPDVDDRLVISPYSTMLALPLAVQESVTNLRALDKTGMKGPMGFYEAIDYSRAASREAGRNQDQREGITIYAYMAHHQGMSLAALDNLLNGNAMRRRFHSDPRVRAIESLLYERIPLASLKATKRKPAPLVMPKPAEGPAERILPALTALPQTLLLGNRSYSVMLTNSGSGYSRWNGIDLTRWRADASVDQWGSFVTLHEPRSRATWSVTRQPVNGDRGEASVSFSADRAEFRRVLLGIESVMSVAVSGDEDVEVRRVTLVNRSRRQRPIEITSCAELCLAKPAADAAHPAFNKIFVETESLENGVLVAHRRLRSAEDPPVWVAHMVVGASHGVAFETNRQTYVGRGRTLADAEGLGRHLNGQTGAVLDPMFVLRCHETLEPRGRLELSFITIAAASRDELLRLIAKHRHAESPNRVLDLAWTHAQLEFRHLQITAEAAHRYQQLAGYLIFPVSPLRPPGARTITNGMGQRDLWALGNSGDLPIITLVIREESGLKLAREILSAHSYWRARGFVADLVLLNQEAGSYDRPMNFALQRLLDAHAREVGLDKPGGVFLRDGSQITEQQRTLLLNSSRVVLSGARGTLALQLPAVREPAPVVAPFVPVESFSEEPSPQLPFLELSYFNGLGGFQPAGHEYAIYLGPGSTTPTPWINVIGTPDFGCMVTESGLGCTWRGNSQQNRLTTWQNDPVSDPASEAIYIRDEESGRVWSPTALPIREDDAYRANHGQGYTRFEHNSHAIGQELTVFVPFDADGPRDTVKICRLRLQNHSSRRRTLTVTYFAEWVLGTLREEQAPHISTNYDEDTGAIFARQSWSNATGATAFAASVPRASSYSGDRGAFLGRNALRANPAGLQQKHLNNQCGGEADPAAVLQVPVTLPVGGFVDVLFLLGEGADVAAARTMLSKYQSVAAADQALAHARRWWDAKLGTLQVQTPDLSVDYLLNRWLTYQTLSCRFWGRSAMYQSSGAYGFRDQLQDSLALLHVAPELSRNHILLASQHQFAEGDVQHWWHPISGMGVRTRCSDDMLWLPFVTAKYIAFTGDKQLWQEVTPFLDGPLLEAHQQEHLFTPGPSVEQGTIWEHCRRAVDNAWRIGEHGIPLMGNGDWNDGMNMVGHEGRGESVWMAWWLITVLRMYSDLAKQRGDAAWAEQCSLRATQLAAAVEKHCWDGQWYLRGFFDDGSPLGSHTNSEARIDSLPQSWAVISGAGDPQRTRQAMESANRELVSDKDRVVKLFTPPFDTSSPHPGYIMGYPPGIRENGGQYTHGSLWLALAWARLQDGDQAVRLMQIMNPVLHCRTPKDVDRYRGEPYVSAADVYTSALQTGRAGWTWYTGSGAWMYRVWIEEILGLERRGNVLVVKPVIPDSWPGFQARYRFGDATYHIHVVRGAEAAVEVDGQRQESRSVPLMSDGREHRVTVVLSGVRQRPALELTASKSST